MDRSWMYDRCNSTRSHLKNAFVEGLDDFIQRAILDQSYQREGGIRCPCVKCKLTHVLTAEQVKYHIEKKGFMPNYFIWTHHGEVGQNLHEDAIPNYDGSGGSSHSPYEAYIESTQHINQMQEMVCNAFGINQTFEAYDELPNEAAQYFYQILSDANEPLWEGSTESKLSICIQLLGAKSDFHIPELGMDRMIKSMVATAKIPNRLPQSYYEAKKLVERLGLGCVRIDCCVNGCMLFYDNEFGLNNGSLNKCSICHSGRYEDRVKGKPVPKKAMFYLPIITRLQRLFASQQTASKMTWHHDNKIFGDKMRHPSDGHAWKYFDTVHQDFSSEPRNVRLGLCSDGFTPYYQTSTKPYSCWPIIVTPYNLPPEMCMSKPYMFLACVIPGPDSPVAGIDIYLQPLIDDLKRLWQGVNTYDISHKQNFTMRAALMWTINDFPAYGMLSGWGTHGKLACPICMEESNAFTLKNGGKPSWFDSHRRFLPRDHMFRRNKKNFLKGVIETRPPLYYPRSDEVWERVSDIPKVFVNSGKITKPAGHGKTHNWWKRSIFWDLPYWKDNLLRHNLDVMHIEKNFFDNVFNTVMNVKGKTKDNEKARLDIEHYCRRPELHLFHKENGRIVKPKGCFSMLPDHVESIYRWVKELKFPDNYCSNLSKCANVEQMKMIGMKSHDCHIFMEYLLPIAFGSLQPAVLNPLIEINQFFKELCCSTLNSEKLVQMNQDIPLILCKLARIFPPGFFDSMEHLPVHLAYEAWLGGPVQYRWMYPFERFMGDAKRSIKNKARVEGSICTAYLHRETINFCSYYFKDHSGLAPRIRRNEVIPGDDRHPLSLSVFCLPGKLQGRGVEIWLKDHELLSAHIHILINCREVQPYIVMFNQQFSQSQLHSHFPEWFRQTVYNEIAEPINQHLRNLADWPSRSVMKYDGYQVNGYNFQTNEWSLRRETYNCGVYVEGESGNGPNTDFYGEIEKIFEFSYPTLDYQKKVVLFYCAWKDQRPSGTIFNYKTNTADVLIDGRYTSYDPFILAHNARQVYFVPYPSIQTTKRGWAAAIKTKPRGRLEQCNDQNEDTAYQQDTMSNSNEPIEIEQVTTLNDDGAGCEEVVFEQDEDEFEEQHDENDYDDRWEL